MPHVFVMTGIPGAGKTTWARVRPEVYIGADAIRKELYGREMTPRGYRRVHRLMLERMRACLEQGQSVVLDASHVSKRARRLVLNAVPEGVTKIAVFVDTSFKQAVVNNQYRERHVPRPGIWFLSKWLVVPDKSEGFDAVWWVGGSSRRQD